MHKEHGKLKLKNFLQNRGHCLQSFSPRFLKCNFTWLKISPCFEFAFNNIQSINNSNQDRTRATNKSKGPQVQVQFIHSDQYWYMRYNSNIYTIMNKLVRGTVYKEI